MAKVKAGIGIGSISGTSGGAVFVQRRDGTILVRERPTFSGSDTDGQRESRRLFSRASSAWRDLTDDEQRAWLAWAKRENPFAGASAAANSFRSLAVRWLAFDPQGDPPRLPPDAPFGGDAVEVAVDGTSSTIRFVADRPNSTGVATELMAVAVRSAISEPRDRDYRILGRMAFAKGALSCEVPATPGRHAVGVRFVLRATGQSTGVLRLGIVRVG